MFKPEGVYYAMLTPFKDGKVYEKTLRQIVEFDIQHGVNGLFPISTSGEFIQMDFNEKVRMMSIVADQAKGRVAVTPGVTAPNARECIALANEAEKLGCNAVVVSPPYYIPITQGMSYQQNIDLIRQLFPRTRHIVAISDNTLTGQGDQRQFWQSAGQNPTMDYRLINTSTLNQDMLIQILQELPSDSVIIYSSFYEDAEGHSYTINEGARFVVEHAAVPVMGVGNHFCG